MGILICEDTYVSEKEKKRPAISVSGSYRSSLLKIVGIGK